MIRHHISIVMWIMFAVAFIGCQSKEQQLAGHLENAQKFMVAKKYSEAILELKNAVQLDPENDSAYYDLGEAYLNWIPRGGAAEAYENAIAINPENLRAQLRMGQIFLDRMEILEARTIVKLLLEKMPEDIDVLNLLARIQIQEKNADAAIRTLEKAVAINSQNKETYLLLGNLLLQRGATDDARQVFLRVQNIDPTEPMAYLELIHLNAITDSWQEIPELLQQLIGITTDRYDYLAKLGLFFEKYKKWEMAEAVYQYAIKAAHPEDAAPLMNLGTFYERRGLSDKALDAMHQALGIRDDDPTILSFLAKSYYDLNRFDEARKFADKSLEKDARHGHGNYIRGRLYFTEKKYKAAIERFDQAIKATPDNALPYYYKALCLLAEKGVASRSETDLFKVAGGYADDTRGWELKLAEHNLNRVLELSPNMLKAKLLLGELYLRDRDSRAARKQIESALAQAPTHGKAVTLLGALKILEGDLAGAANLCKMVIKNNPRNSQWHTRLGMIYNMMGRSEDALQALEQALSLSPEDIQPLKMIVKIHLAEKQFGKALAVCDLHKEKVVGDPENSAGVEHLKGTVYLAQGDNQTARKYFESAIAGYPAFIAPRFELARLDTVIRKFDAAASHYQKILSINPENIDACMALGNLYYNQNDREKAEKYYRQALLIDSGYGPAANNLAYILSNREETLDEAFRLAKLATQKMPRNANARDTLGWIYYLKENYGKAIIEFEQSLAINSANPIAHYHLGLAYYKRNAFDKSRKHIRRALALDSVFPGSDQARIMLDE